METENKKNPILAAVRCAVIELDISGTATYYKEKIWVDDLNEDAGGTFQFVRKRYAQPKLILNFVGEVDIELELNATYTDGFNLFRAIDKNKIQNMETHLNSFKLPKELACVSRLTDGLDAVRQLPVI